MRETTGAADSPPRPLIPVEVLINQLVRDMVRAAPPMIRDSVERAGRRLAAEIAREVLASGYTFMVFSGEQDETPARLLCLYCGRMSHNPNDAAHGYCANCHVFHERHDTVGPC